MNIDNNLQKLQGNPHFHRHTQAVDGAVQDQTGKLTRHKHHQRDALQLSDAGKSSATSKLEIDQQKTLDADQRLSIQILSQMFQRITGQELQITTPSDLPPGSDVSSVQVPAQPPAGQPDSSQAGTYQQSLSYFEAQVATFSAEGSINTKDGQSIKFNVSLSMSRLFYSQATINQSNPNAGQDQPLQVSYEGLAAQLTSTSFQFSIDQGGSVDQVNQPHPTPTSTQTAAPVNGASISHPQAQDLDADADAKPKLQDSLHDLEESMFHLARKLFKALRIWQRYQDGSQQLMALGAPQLGALFVGHETKAMPGNSDQNPVAGNSANNSLLATDPQPTSSRLDLAA